MNPVKAQVWIIEHCETLAGFLSGSIITPTLLNFTLTILQTGLLALISGALGALGAHYVKKIITKYENKIPKN